jgi:hypothetical protein
MHRIIGVVSSLIEGLTLGMDLSAKELSKVTTIHEVSALLIPA